MFLKTYNICAEAYHVCGIFDEND